MSHLCVCVCVELQPIDLAWERLRFEKALVNIWRQLPGFL